MIVILVIVIVVVIVILVTVIVIAVDLWRLLCLITVQNTYFQFRNIFDLFCDVGVNVSAATLSVSQFHYSMKNY